MLLAKLVCFTMTCHVQECAQHFSQKKKKEKKNQFILIAMVPKVILSKQITLTSSLMTFQYKFQKHQCLAKNSNLLIFVF